MISFLRANRLVWDAETNEGASVADDDECNLIRLLKQRDRSAWSAAVDRHLGELYGFVFHLVGGDRTVAQDLTQEAWLEAVDGIGHCDAARGSFRNWLFGIARKRVALHFRRRALAGSASSLSGSYVEAIELADISSLPEEALEQVEQRDAVRAALLLLPGDRREVLLSKYVEGLSVAAIADRMGRTAKAVESLLSRAREQVRGLLGGTMMPCRNEQRIVKESSSD